MSWLVELLSEADWGEFEAERKALQQWEHYPIFLEALQNLNREALFQSHIHGDGHIERVMLHGAILAMRTRCDAADVALLLDACSYHDTGRVDDSVDHAHGQRSALKLGRLTGRNGQELKVLEAIVEAHSRWDGELDDVLQQYRVADISRARRLAFLLKDADGLDRVRLSDLDVKYLRWAGSLEQAGFAEWLFQKTRDWETRNRHRFA